jgi:phosphate transport system permease protein
LSARHESTADRAFHVVCVVGVALPLVFGGWFVVDTFVRAWPGLSSPHVRLGLLAALEESGRLVGAAVAVSLPLGIGAAIYLEHLASQRFFTALAQRAITLLAAVPSVLYGLFGVTLFTLVLGVRSMFVTAAMTLGLFLFPVIVERTRSALRTVSPSVHEASLALGADAWRALVHVVLPLAWPRLVAEVLLVIARALGTVAPLLMVERLVAVPRIARIEPIATRIFDSVVDPDPTQQTIAAAATITLLTLIVLLHVLAHRLAAPSLPDVPRSGREGLSERGVA